MATMSDAQCRRMYSWWWDSHISPKNSKWLQENLTDMDAKIKTMIKLIEEDADSFARRAEMYYKKRPELMKLVEEFYRAYRALAERYDHATGALRQAHRTIAEAFPNQVPMVLADGSPASNSVEAKPFKPEMQPLVRALFDPDEWQEDTPAVFSSDFRTVKTAAVFSKISDSVTSRKGLKQLEDLFGSREVLSRARKGLNFQEAGEAQSLLACDLTCKSVNEIQTLKEALAKLEAEKDTNLALYQQNLDRLSNLELEISHAQQDSRGLNEQATKAEAEFQSLKDALSRLASEREVGLLQYQQCFNKIQNLENSISQAKEDAGEFSEQQGSKAEIEIKSLKHDLSKLEAEKDALLLQQRLSSEKISNLESMLSHAEEEAARINDQAVKAENEIENLKHVLAMLTEEKNAAALQCQQYSEKISDLEREISCAQEEAQRLNVEIDTGLVKLNGAEERCCILESSNHSMQFELESLALKMRTLTEKQQELERLWTSVHEERLQFMEVETAFQSLQQIHSESQRELRLLTAESQEGDQMLKDMESRNQGLQYELKMVKDESRSQIELNQSLLLSVDKKQDEICKLREQIGKLEEEVGLQVDQRNALHQELYCMKEELNDLNKKLKAVLERIDSVGLNPESFESTVKQLQDDNTMLREIFQIEKSEKVTLLEKLEMMEKVLEQNATLENSLSHLNAESVKFREKFKALEDSCKSLLEENLALVADKGDLISQLQIARQNFEKLSVKNAFLENSLSESHAEVEGLKENLRSMEDLSHLLDSEKSSLLTERDALASQFESTEQRLQDLQDRYTQLKERNSSLENDKNCILQKLEELSISLDAEIKERGRFTWSTENRLAGLEAQIHLMEGGWVRRKELEEQLENAVNAQIEIFILQNSVQDLEEKNFSLMIDCQNSVEMTELSERLIYDLQHQNLKQQAEVRSLNDKTRSLRTGMCQIYKALDNDINSDYKCAGEIEQDRMLLSHILAKLEERKNSLNRFQDDKQKLDIECSVLVTLLGQLKLEATNIEAEKNTIGQEFRMMTEQLSVLLNDCHKFVRVNEDWKFKLKEGNHKQELLTSGMKDLHWLLLDLQGAIQDMKSENFQVVDEKRLLMRKFMDVIEQKNSLEEEHTVILGEAFSLSNLSLTLMNFVAEKSVEQKELGENLDKLHGINTANEETVKILEGKLEKLKMENFHLKDSLERSENELRAQGLVNDGMIHEIAYGKDLLCQRGMELLEAEEKLSAMQVEKTEWLKTIEDLKKKYDAVKVMREDQEKQIVIQTQYKDQLTKENVYLYEVIERLQADLYRLHKEHGDTKIREESLNSDLRKERREIKLWQDEAAAIFSQLQVSAIHEVVFEEKARELNNICESFQGLSRLKDMENDLLKERVGTLQNENGRVKSQLASYVPAIAALRDCVTSLENRILSRTNFPASDCLAAEKIEEIHLDAESCQKLSQDENGMVLDGFLELQELQTRILCTEKAVMEMERLAEQESFGVNVKLANAVKQVEELQFQRTLHEENPQRSNHGPSDDMEQSKTVSEICEMENELLLKDIMLDQGSECSSLYRIDKLENVKVAKQVPELWETTDQNNSINLTVGRPKSVSTELAKKMVEKELSVDKLEISKSSRVHTSQDGNKRKILDRLTSDAQKLANLEITVQDLKRKVEITEQNKKGKGIEHDTLMAQLEEAEEAIQKLYNINGRLMKNTLDNFSFPNGKLAMEPEESGSVRRRKVYEQARRGSEKIVRLQLDVQKIQFALLKIDDEKERKARTRLPERKGGRVILRDYLYGGIRSSQKKQKKAQCCACVQPPTKGD